MKRISRTIYTIVICAVLAGIFPGCAARGRSSPPPVPPAPEKAPIVQAEPEPPEAQPPEEIPEEEPAVEETGPAGETEPPLEPVADYSGYKLAAFTFDDGPGAYTAELLDGLAQRGAKATFFLITVNVTEDSAKLIRRMDAEGHEVASHTATHARLTELSADAIGREVSGADDVLRGITGKTPALLRPPFGAFDDFVIGAARKPIVKWSVDPRDWEDMDKDSVLGKILDKVTDGDVIIMHEHKIHSVHAALEAMDILAGEGYRFVTVSELFAAKGMALEAGNSYNRPD